MEKDWIVVFETDQAYQAEIAKKILTDNEINAVILNQHDSSYTSFGQIAVYVHQNFKNKAIDLLKELKN